MKRILVIDEDREFRGFLRTILQRHYEVLEAASPREALQVVARVHPDLVILDQSLDDVCRRLRAHPATRAIPVLMLVGVDDEAARGGTWSSRVRCLDDGADDAMDKPFYPEELLAKIRARLRSRDFELSVRAELSIGNLRMDPVTLAVEVSGRSITLTPTEFDLLRYFLERTDRVVPRKQLLGDLWPDAIVTRRTIDTHIANLRKKLHGFDHGFETIYGSGYRLTCRGEPER
jgi:two-component system phosphate regulon response regulator PhoB